MSRKIIQISSTLYKYVSHDVIGFNSVFALCDDGSMWHKILGKSWEIIENIPQSEGKICKNCGEIYESHSGGRLPFCQDVVAPRGFSNSKVFSESEGK